MRFPDAVTILRATGEDEYGNPGSWDAAVTEIAAEGFLVKGDAPGGLVTSYGLLLMPPATDVRLEDRVVVSGTTYEIHNAQLARSASAAKVWSVSVKRLSAQP